MAASNMELISMCVDFTLDNSFKLEDKISKALSKSGATIHVNGLRMLRLQKFILVIGVFSIFESFIQNQTGWERPFSQLEEYLKTKGEDNLGERFSNYKPAINVLKHGRGVSYDRLLRRRAELDFNVKDESFFFEGDVSEVEVLIDVDDVFIKNCIDIIDKISLLLPQS